VSFTAGLKVVYRNKDEEVVTQSNFSPYSNAAAYYYDYPIVIGASTSQTIFSYNSPFNLIFPTETSDLLLVKNKGQGAVRLQYMNLAGATADIEIKSGKLLLVQDVDVIYEIVLVNAGAYSNEVEIFHAGH